MFVCFYLRLPFPRMSIIDLSRQRSCLTLEWQTALLPDQHDKHIISLQTKVGKGQLFVKLGLLLASDSPTVRWSTVHGTSTRAMPDHPYETLGPRETNGNMDHMHHAGLWVMKLCLISFKSSSCQCLLTCLLYRTILSVHENDHWGSEHSRYCIAKSYFCHLKVIVLTSSHTSLVLPTICRWGYLFILTCPDPK